MNTSGTAMSTCGSGGALAGGAVCRPGRARGGHAVRIRGRRAGAHCTGAPHTVWWPAAGHCAMQAAGLAKPQRQVPHLCEGRPRKGGHLVQIGAEKQEGGQPCRPYGIALHAMDRKEASLRLCERACPARRGGCSQRGASSRASAVHAWCMISGARGACTGPRAAPVHLGGCLGCVPHRIQHVCDLPDALRLLRHLHNPARVVCGGWQGGAGAGRWVSAAHAASMPCSACCACWHALTRRGAARQPRNPGQPCAAQGSAHPRSGQTCPL